MGRVATLNETMNKPLKWTIMQTRSILSVYAGDLVGYIKNTETL